MGGGVGEGVGAGVGAGAGGGGAGGGCGGCCLVGISWTWDCPLGRFLFIQSLK